MQNTPPLTRAAGLRALAAFTPRMGRAYTEHRNTDAGDDAPTTSRLSPYIRRRLITEAETIAAAQAAHGREADKFIDEVLWRTYFKGYLERRPGIWADYLENVAVQQAKLEQARLYQQAITGQTGIDCFDDWAQALVRDNWLHNHTRMWFASIWIFTLGLPWQLGADFFLKNLIDGDPASNTLSWRWVAGLHTRGKHYVARAENIRRFTEGRYAPTGLNEHPLPLTEPNPPPDPTPLPQPAAPPAGEVVLLLHLDDLSPESLELSPARVAAVWPILVHVQGAAEAVKQADEAAMKDALARASAAFNCTIAPADPALATVSAWAPVGPSRDALPEALHIRRRWDEAAWPFCTSSFGALRRRKDILF